MPIRLSLLTADADYRHAYREEALDAADRARLTRFPHLAQRADWQTSRALKQLLPETARAYCISHDQGCAALLWADAPCALGVDIQVMREKAFERLLPIFAREDECAWWQTQDDARLAFYRLWTLKEALIKAAGLDFPADLRRVGWFRQPDGTFAASAAGQLWQSDWRLPWHGVLLCAVWPADTAAAYRVCRADSRGTP